MLGDQLFFCRLLLLSFIPVSTVSRSFRFFSRSPAILILLLVVVTVAIAVAVAVAVADAITIAIGVVDDDILPYDDDRWCDWSII